MIVIVDNRDSFVWNLAEYVSLFDRVKVVGNDVSFGEIKKLDPDGIIISPGPGSPDSRRDAGNSPEIVLRADVPVLGVCLGHQIIGHVFGGKVGRVEPCHGKGSMVVHDRKEIFRGVENPLFAGRYHSLAVLGVPEGFRVTAKTDGTVMGIRSRDGMIEGIQFHPESIITPRHVGLRIIRNFVMKCR